MYIHTIVSGSIKYDVLILLLIFIDSMLPTNYSSLSSRLDSGNRGTMKKRKRTEINNL